MSDAFDVAEWLGGEVEDPRTRAPHTLPEKLKVILEDGFNDEVFNEDDVTALTSSTFDKLAEEKWVAIHKDSVGSKKEHRELATHRIALVRWLQLSYPSLDGTSSNDGSDLAVSEKERGDLKEQGLPDTRALRMLELSLTLLRATGKHELSGGTYEGEPLSYLVAKDAAKRGDTTIMKVLAECRKLGSPHPLVRESSATVQLVSTTMRRSSAMAASTSSGTTEYTCGPSAMSIAWSKHHVYSASSRYLPRRSPG